MSASDGGNAAPVSENSYSVQHRCPQMAKHDSNPPLPVPCPECYSLLVTSTRIPYQKSVRWRSEPINV